MKCTRLDPDAKAAPLWRFAKRTMPASIKCVRWEGYGQHHELRTVAGDHLVASIEDIIFFPRLVKWWHGCDDVITVYQPQYLSDVEDMVRKFESETKRSVWVRYFADSGRARG